MIISYLHNYIFIKTKKTAGSSMEVALSIGAGPDDVVTPLGLNEELERFSICEDALPRNFSSDRWSEQAFVTALKNQNKREMRRFYEMMRRLNHFPVQRHSGATSAREVAGDTFWNGAYKFTIERHPYEKAVSLAWFERHRISFEESLESVLSENRYRNFDLYVIDGKPVVDFIIRYEKLADDVRRVEKALGGLSILDRLPRSNSRQRKDRRPAAEVLTDRQKDIVYETCRDEFELMNYER